MRNPDTADTSIMAENGKGDGKRWVGQPVRRKEESRLLRGQGKFVDDIKLRDMAYLRLRALAVCSRPR